MKRIIKKLILEHNSFEDADSGVISKFAKKKNVDGISIKLNTFFSTNSSNFEYSDRQVRKRFNVQILIPIAELYLTHLSENREDTTLAFDQIFKDNKPNIAILDAFEKHWGFRFEELQWEFNKEVINKIVESVFDPLMRYLSVLVFSKKCDFVLLAGRPTTLPIIYELLLRYFPIMPSRIITLNDYRVGRWYPFQKGDGNYSDRKSIVTVGAAIALMGGKLDMLAPFRINTKNLISKITSTSEHFGLSNGIDSFTQSFISPDINKVKIKIDSLPQQISSKQLLSVFYPDKLTYELFYDLENIKKKLESDENSGKISKEDIQIFLIKLKNRMPYTVTIIREYKRSKERLKIENIVDSSKRALSSSFFKLKLKTISPKKGHWMDTGEFVENVASN